MPTEGQTAINRQTGETAVFRGGQWVKNPQGAGADAAQRGRLAMGLAPMVQAQQTMSNMEQGVNPLNRDWGASMLAGVGFGQTHPFEGVARAWGGQDYQDYTQAAKAFESQLMPLMSGAAVSPSEAQRQIKASLPEFLDTPETLRSKSQMREMLVNGAAKSSGAPLPYQNQPTYGVNTAQLPPPGGQHPPVAGGQQGEVRVNSPMEARQLPIGTVFITPDGRRKVRR